MSQYQVFHPMVSNTTQTLNQANLGRLEQRREVSLSLSNQRFVRGNNKIVNPGPGEYMLPSDFGIYRARKKFVEENERLEKARMTFSKSHSSMQSQGSARSNRN